MIFQHLFQDLFPETPPTRVGTVWLKRHVMHAADARAMAAKIANGSSSNQHFTTPDQHLYFGISAHRAISHESVFS